MTAEPITEGDLAYYVDDQLTPERRIEVEAYLAQQPGVAARIMEDLKNSRELRLTATNLSGEPHPFTGDLARKLQASLGRRALLQRLRLGIAACLLLMAGAAGGGTLALSLMKPSTSDYVDAALQAHMVSQVRSVMISQPEAPQYDREELLSATAIVMPTLPEGWTVSDVQVYPSRFGPSVEMAIDAGELGRASIFAARPGSFDVHPPMVESHDGIIFGHWQTGEIAYVLVGTSEPSIILSAAQELADTLY